MGAIDPGGIPADGYDCLEEGSPGREGLAALSSGKKHSPPLHVGGGECQ